MACARPSTTAVLPAPGSPMRTGLFLVRRDSTCMTRSISFSRPMTGSSLDSRAACVRLRPNWSSTSEVDGGPSGGARGGGGDGAGRRRLALADDLLDLVAGSLEGDAEGLERLGSDTLALVDQPEQDVL